MPRRAAANRREVQPDAVYNNRLVTQLINKVLLDGKKATAERIVYTAFEIVAEKSEGGDISLPSRRLWITSSPRSRLSQAMSVALPIRSRWRSTPVVPPLWVSAGWSTSPALARRRPWPSVSPRDPRRFQRPGRFRQEARGRLQDGRGQPRVLSLSLVS